ncbi:hypothetical protein BZG36_02372 [Bifiguratus adelaidae]|uniref:Chitin synthase n=1 Tax=Bifiguratus adelaidae TaxID=1938954 RepID=A0A261Y130_9FUNG|nr:hypothetical protein BZG36_02372 [Bifiguratus adelaidae]
MAYNGWGMNRLARPSGRNQYEDHGSLLMHASPMGTQPSPTAPLPSSHFRPPPRSPGYGPLTPTSPASRYGLPPGYHTPASIPPFSSPRPLGYRKTVRHIELQQGNLVFDHPVSTKLLQQVRYNQGEEFTHMRYSAITCDPAQMVACKYTVRQQLWKRRTELMIIVTVCDEEAGSFLRTINAVISNIAHLCNRSKSKTWGMDGWQKIVVCIVADGRSKINPRVLQVLGAMGCYQDGVARTQVAGKPVAGHMYEYTAQVAVDPESSRLYGVDKGSAPMQVLFLLKEQNRKKLNSHLWALRGLAPMLNPNICIMLDVGTKPGGTALYHMWKTFDRASYVGAACGEIEVDLGEGWSKLLNPMTAAQNFEFKMSYILDKPLESVFGYISALPSNFSAYRYAALKDTGPGEGPLATYFKPEEGDISDAKGVFQANMYLAEDRILAFELIAKRDVGWLTKYVRGAKAKIQVPTSAALFVAQRRRSVNGRFFAQLYSVVHYGKVLSGGLNIWRKFLLFFFTIYNFICLMYDWFCLANFYLTFFFLTNASIPITYETYTNGKIATSQIPAGVPDPFFGEGQIIFSVLRELYIMLIVILFITSLGNRPQASKVLYLIIFILFAIVSIIVIYVLIFIMFKTMPKSVAAWKAAVHILSASPAFRDIFFSLGATLILYLIMSCVYADPWHIFTCLLQYLAVLPGYVNITMVYAFCNVHDVQWGETAEKPPALGAAAVVTNKQGAQIATVEVPVKKSDINANYEEYLRDLSRPEIKAPSKRDKVTKQQDYYKLFRTNLILGWMFSNALLIIVLSSNSMMQWIATHISPVLASSAQSYNPYLTFILWSVLGFAVVRSAGSLFYLGFRLVLG